MPKPNPSDTDQPLVKLVSVTIIKENHEHNGQSIPVGESIDVDPDTAEWLREHKIIEG
jgi:hypothetical protein